VRAVALLSVIVALLTGCGGSASVVVPYTVGLKESLATQVAEEAGLQPKIEYGSGGGEKGFVYFQSPREGSKVEDGDTLTMRVSTGP
jgi:beta-lactam-binding protein with PASTA domain